MSETILEVEHLARHYLLPRERLFAPRPWVRAVDGVSFKIEARRSFAIVGESGSGKSTLARLVMALDRPSAGRIRLFGRDLATLGRRALGAARREFQMVFQDPYGSLDPRQSVLKIVAEPLAALGEARAAQRRRVGEMLEAVGLRAADMGKYPHEFSGGQRQRIAIARALVTRPRLIVADEPVSALDVSVQAQVLNLLQDMSREFGVTYLLISHDLAVVDHVCDEAAVMYRGRIVEQAPTGRLFRRAAHPYTRALIDAVPQPVPGRRRRAARPPPAVEAGADERGCPYAARCAFAEPRCRETAPALRPVGERHLAACHVAERVMAG
jgi:peptide/nickel transport system ATP-binding protein